MSKKNTTSTVKFASGFYDSSLSKQGRNGEQERFPMDFYTGNTSKDALKKVNEDFQGNFYKTDKS